MDFFFVEYRDPIVGLIFLTILIFVISISNLIWKTFANKDNEQNLEKFIKKFEINNDHKELLKASNLSLNNLNSLADIFTKSGEFEKATQIYLISLEKSKDKNEQEYIFLSLAKIYFKAGFLEKSKEVLLNALKIRPRNKEALKLLKIIYLRLKNYKEVLNILNCLFELNEDISKEKEFIKLLQINNDDIDKNEKIAKIIKENIQNNDFSKRFLYQNYNYFIEQNLENIIDLINHYIRTNDEKYEEFFYALGFTNENIKFKNNKFKMFKILKDNNFKVKFNFSYICLECKNQMPMFVYHCPICYEFGKCKIIYEVKDDERY